MQPRWRVPRPVGYVVFDCETTGTDSTEDEIVSFALVRLDADGGETHRLHASSALRSGSRPTPRLCTGSRTRTSATRHGSPTSQTRCSTSSGRRCSSPTMFASIWPCSNTRSRGSGSTIDRTATACTLEAFRLLEPRADNHRLQSICERRGIPLHDAHEATSDVLATVALLRVLLDAGVAPETVRLDETAYQRLRSRGDTRPASEPQLRRVYGMARSAGLLGVDGTVDRDRVGALVREIVGSGDVDVLTRSEVQDVYDALDELIEQRVALPPAASA